MSEIEGLLDATVEVLGQRVMSKDELRTELSARSVELGEADQYGLDALDRLVQLTPQLGQITADDVAHLPSLYAGIQWSLPISSDDARNGFVAATPLLEPLVEMMLDGTVAMIDAEGTALGNALVDGAEIDGTGVDVVIPPPGLLTQLAGHVAALTVVDAATIRIETSEHVDASTASEAQLAAVRAAFDEHAEARTIITPLDGGEVELTTAPLGSVVASMVVADREAFAAAPVPPIDRLIDAAGLSIQRGLVGTADTDWASMIAWQTMNLVQLNHELTDEQAAAYTVLVAAPNVTSTSNSTHDDEHEHGASADPQAASAPVAGSEPDLAPERAAHPESAIDVDGAVVEPTAASAPAAGSEPDVAPVRPVDAQRSVGSDVDVDGVENALNDAKVAELAWGAWTDTHLVGEGLASFVESLSASTAPGVAWVRARQLMLSGDTDQSIEVLESARSSGHAMVLADLAAFAADRSEPLVAKALLDEAGVMTEVDLDEEYDPATSTSSFGRELAEEIAPFAAIRPRAMAGRNDPCPCGSGRKYKQCHLGNELHELEHRAGWLYVKMMRFMQLTNPGVPSMIAETIVSDVESADLRTMLSESYLPIDMALHEGRVADRFLDAKRSLLPRDEIELVEQWIDTTRSVYEVVRSTADSMDVIDLATRNRLTVRDTVPEEPLEAGWKVIGRLVPVDDSYRAYSGFLPVNDDMVDVMLQGFGTRQLEMVAITIGQIFQTAETHDGMQSLFDDSVDETELRALIEQMAVEMSEGNAESNSDAPASDV